MGDSETANTLSHTPGKLGGQRRADALLTLRYARPRGGVMCLTYTHPYG